MLKRRNTGGGDLPKIVGFAKVKNMTQGDTIAGTYTGSLTTKGEYPKLNHIIVLAQPFSFVSYDSQKEANVTINGQPGDAVALETTAVLGKEISDSDKGKEITIIFEGVSKTKKPGQRPAYLVGVYDGLPDDAPMPAVVAAAAAPKAAFPYSVNKK